MVVRFGMNGASAMMHKAKEGFVELSNNPDQLVNAAKHLERLVTYGTAMVCLYAMFHPEPQQSVIVQLLNKGGLKVLVVSGIFICGITMLLVFLLQS